MDDVKGGRRPRFKLPEGACDTHCHIFGPGQRFPYASSCTFEPKDSTKEDLAKLYRRLNIGRSVIVQSTAHGLDNSAMLDALASAPSEYRGVAIVDDSVSDRTLADLHNAGVRGVRFNFVQSLGAPPSRAMFETVVRRIKPLGWHVVLHLKVGELDPHKDMIDRLDIPFVIDHVGRPDVTSGIDQPGFKYLLGLSEREGAWIKLSAIERMCSFPYSDAVPYLQAIMAAFPDRVIWGMDFPHPNLIEAVDEADLVDLIPSFAEDEERQRKLLVDNPARLYDFGEI